MGNVTGTLATTIFLWRGSTAQLGAAYQSSNLSWQRQSSSGGDLQLPTNRMRWKVSENREVG